MAVERVRQGIAKRRASDVEIEATLHEHVPDAAGARRLLMQDCQYSRSGSGKHRGQNQQMICRIITTSSKVRSAIA
jgi:hypothetical protein